MAKLFEPGSVTPMLPNVTMLPPATTWMPVPAQRLAAAVVGEATGVVIVVAVGVTVAVASGVWADVPAEVATTAITDATRKRAAGRRSFVFMHSIKADPCSRQHCPRARKRLQSPCKHGIRQKLSLSAQL
jgi:hypothetical protein